jgi:hypothetical protein
MTNHPNRKGKAAPKAKVPSDLDLGRVIKQMKLGDMLGAIDDMKEAIEYVLPQIVECGIAHTKLLYQYEPFIGLYVSLTFIEQVRRASATKGAKPGQFTQLLETLQMIVEERFDETEAEIAAEGGDPHALEPELPQAEPDVDDMIDAFADLPPENYYEVDDPQGIPPRTIERMGRVLTTFIRQTGDFGGDERFTVKSVDYQGFTGEMVIMLDEID